MEAKHTPGPWWSSKDQDARGLYGWRIDSASRALMAWAAWPSEEERDSIEAESTARLLAAAPELLAALSRTLDLAIGHACEARGINAEDCEAWPWVQKSRAAIAKATGATARGEQ